MSDVPRDSRQIVCVQYQRVQAGFAFGEPNRAILTIWRLWHTIHRTFPNTKWLLDLGGSSEFVFRATESELSDFTANFISTCFDN